MMKKNKKTFDVTKFESLQTIGNELKGGFSTAYMGGNGKLDEIIKANIGDCSTSNTCNTGNCIVGCGVK
ncbi:hypothetical protein [Myroides sp. TSA_177.3]|uniref:hypothetical protein n=1 Tax=Myroides sp. TSA_177.3 TaxID=3415650 RepID=UPI00404564C3